jgi:DNA topoisomerase-6 subunit B
VATDDTRQRPQFPDQAPHSPLFGAPDPGARERDAAGLPLIKKTAHMKSRSLIPASESGPTLPLFDVPDAKASRAAGKSGKPPQGKAGAAPARGKGASKRGKSRAGESAGKSRGGVRSATQGSRAAKPSPARSSKTGSAPSLRPSRDEKAARPVPSRKNGRAAQAKFAFSNDDPSETAPAPEALASDDETFLPAEPMESADEAATPLPAAAGRGRPARETAHTLAAKQREISISEFFTKNRHLLGFDNPQKALLTAVKEAVDNALDACEEAGILPTLEIGITELAEDRFRIRITDNGPGIVRQQIPKIFGKLLYGSKFHRLRQGRGQQGIGISAAGMYGQLTTGKPVAIISKIGKGKPSHYFEIQIDTRKNQPEVVKDEIVPWDADHGTAVEIELEGTYKKGRRSVDDYVEQTALANPHATIAYRPPKSDEIRYERVAKELPREALEIKPHPHGVELGALMQMMKETRARNVRAAMQQDFSRVSGRVADEILKVAGVLGSRAPHKMTPAELEKLHKGIQKTKIMAPPTNCLSPIGEELIFKGLAARVQADFVTSSTRPPSVYRGQPFQVEVGLAYGGSLPAEELVEVYRFANRVPLQYQQSACAITKAVVTTDWRGYGLSQSKGAPPAGPMILFVHIASVWVPFTSESKEAVAHYPEIIKELRLALQECGRRLGTHVRHHRRVQDELKKRSYIDKYLPAIAEALQDILALSDKQRDVTVANLKDVLEKSRKV